MATIAGHSRPTVMKGQLDTPQPSQRAQLPS
jgi:hypothetical protein